LTTVVRYTRSAEADLLEAWAFLAEFSFEAADRILDAIGQGAQMLAEHPLMGQQRQELGTNVRYWPTKTSYNLYYLPHPEGIVILRVLHHARDVLSRDLPSA
jgi:toxin ParE1/3/4